MTEHQVFLGLHESLDEQAAAYDEQKFQQVLEKTLAIMDAKLQAGEVNFAYFPEAVSYWHQPKTLDVYITNASEGQALNLQARGKDYATNVLSYPSDLPAELLKILPEISLGELILCHEVVTREALEQGKPFGDHLTHLLVHGILHLLGFDHEISDADADEMEGFEIEILASLGIANPYLEN